jgi:hypothetical protein
MPEVTPESSGSVEEPTKEVSKEDQFIEAVGLSRDNATKAEEIVKSIWGEEEKRGETIDIERDTNPLSPLALIFIVGSGKQISIERKIELSIGVFQAGIENNKNLESYHPVLRTGITEEERQKIIQGFQLKIERLQQIK